MTPEHCNKPTGDLSAIAECISGSRSGEARAAISWEVGCPLGYTRLTTTQDTMLEAFAAGLQVRAVLRDMDPLWRKPAKVRREAGEHLRDMSTVMSTTLCDDLLEDRRTYQRIYKSDLPSCKMVKIMRFRLRASHTHTHRKTCQPTQTS